MKSVLWRVAKPLSCIEDARCLKVKWYSMRIGKCLSDAVPIQNGLGGGGGNACNHYFSTLVSNILLRKCKKTVLTVEINVIS